MKTVSKALLCLALTLVMALSGLSAMAADTGDYVAANTTTGVEYTDVSDAIRAAEAGQTIALLKDATDDYVSVYEDITLDLAGYSMTAKYMTSFGYIIDSSAANTGVLVVNPSRFMLQTTNKQLPVYNGTGYQFADILGFNTAYLADGRYAFQVLVEPSVHSLLKQGSAVTGVKVQVDVSWNQDGHTRTQQFTYNDTMVNTFLSSYNASTGKYSKMFTLSLNGADNFENLKLNSGIVSITGVHVAAGTDKEEDKLDPDYELPTGLTATYGQTLADVALPEGFSWKDASASVGNAGTNSFTAVYTPADTDKYNTVEVDVTVEVAKADPTYEIPTGLTATYGQILADVALPEGFTWESTGSVGNAGTNGFTVSYSNGDSNYNTVTGINVTVEVAKAAAAVTAAPTANELTYNGSAQALVSGGTAQGGKLVYSLTGDQFTEAVPTGTDAGAYTVYYMVLGDENHFDSQAGSVAVTIEQAEPTVTAQPVVKTELTYNTEEQPLVDAGSVEGGEIWYKVEKAAKATRSIVVDADGFSPVIPTAKNAGTYTVYYKVKGDSNHKDSAVSQLTVTVKKANPVVPQTNVNATYGDTLTGTALPEGFTWTDTSASVGNAGTNSFTATYTPEDTENYNTVEVQVNVEVAKADPTYTVPTGLTATYGDTLADVALPEGFTWVDSSLSVGNAGTNSFAAIYNNGDSNYNTVEVEITIDVAKADPTYEIPTGLTATYGDTLADVALPEGFTWVDSSASVGNAGTNSFAAIYNNGDANYNTAQVEISVEVAKADPTYTVPTGLTATYGDTLANVALPEGFTWVDSSASVGNAGTNSFAAIYNNGDSNYNTAQVEISILVSRVNETKFLVAFDHDAATEGNQNHVDSYLYRVGNLNTVTLSSLFEAADGAAIGTVSVTVEPISGAGVSGTYTANTDWTKGTIQFSGTGVVKVTVTDNDYCQPTVLMLEVVKAKNTVSVESSTGGTSLVLLNNIAISADGTVHYQNCTVYGNGFTFDVRGGMNAYDSKQGHGIIIAKNATIDNLVVIGDVYDSYGAYTTTMTGATQENYTGAIDATGCIIQNCYIANCAAPIRSNGNTITNTTLYGGTVANLIISGGTNTLTDVTTVNYNDGREILGLGIVVSDGAAENTRIILNGYLKQHNFVCQADSSKVPSGEAQSLFNSMFGDTFAAYHIGDPAYVNTGIVFLTSTLNTDIITDNANTGYLPNDDVEVTIRGSLGSTTVEGAIYSVPATGTVDNNYVASDSVQGDYLPTFTFDLGDQAISYEGETDSRFMYLDGETVMAAYTTGQETISLDLNALAQSSTVTKHGQTLPLSAACLDANGDPMTATNGVVTLTDQGIYTLVFTATDDLLYDANGQQTNTAVTRTYTVTVDLTVKDATVADATITVSSSNLTGEYITSSTNKKYKMYPLKAITGIMDDANKDGTLETFNFKSNISSAVITPEGVNAFSSAMTVTVTYSGGQVLTVTLGTPSGLNSPGASNGGKTFSVYTDSTNGIYLQSDGAIASSSTATGTWPITGWTFKGTSGTVVSNSTQVTINFTKTSCVTGDTLITLADGTQKRVDKLSSDDLLLAWDFETGAYAAAPAGILECHGTQVFRVLYLNFSDGTTLKIIEDHGLFDKGINDFVYISENNAASYVGHSFVKADGEGYTTVTLNSYQVMEEYTSSWTVQTAFYNNCMSNGMFTMNTPDFEGWLDYFDITDEMVYDQAHKQAEIEKYGLADYEQFAHLVTYEQFLAFNGQYLNILMGRGVLTMEDLEWLVDQYLR